MPCRGTLVWYGEGMADEITEAFAEALDFRAFVQRLALRMELSDEEVGRLERSKAVIAAWHRYRWVRA